MKNTGRILAILAASVTTAAVPVMAEEHSSTELENLFYTYSQDNLLDEYYDADYVVASGGLQQKSYDAFLTVQETDLNWDGVNELLAVRLKPQKDDSGQTINTIVAEVYQKQENALKRITQYTLAEGILGQSEAEVDVFLVESQNGQIVCCEAKDTAAVLADGVQWSLRAASFDGSTFTEVQNESLTGSAFVQEELDRAFAAMSGLGLQAADVVWTSAVDQLGYLEPICTIDRYLITEQSEVYTFVNNGGSDSETMQYGETVFRNCWNGDWENKLQKDFTVVLEQTVPVSANSENGLSNAGEFVIADSNSRYITEEELAALSEQEILIARNEIYARHGRQFNNAELSAYFSSKSWYQPTVAGADFTEEYAASVFNEIEIANISTIVNYENAHGLNDFE